MRWLIHNDLIFVETLLMFLMQSSHSQGDLHSASDSYSSLKILECCYKGLPGVSLLQTENTQLSQPVFRGEVLQPSPLWMFFGPSLTAPCLSCVGDSRSGHSLMKVDQIGRITSFHLLIMLLFDASQDMVCSVGFKHMLSARVEHP